MPRVVFTSHLQKHLECPSRDVSGKTVAEALQEVFEENPRLAGYILDDQRSLRQHVMIFVDQQMIRDRVRLTDSVSSSSEIYVMQALSGG